MFFKSLLAMGLLASSVSANSLLSRASTSSQAQNGSIPTKIGRGYFADICDGEDSRQPACDTNCVKYEFEARVPPKVR